MRAKRFVTRLAEASLVTAGWAGSAAAQDSSSAGPVFTLEARGGTIATLGATRQRLQAPLVVAGVTFSFKVTDRLWGWTSIEYQPSAESTSWYEPSELPVVGLYSLTAGVSRRFGVPLTKIRWRPFELGLGLGASQTDIYGLNRYWTSPPSGADTERLDPALLSSIRWRPTVAARARFEIPVWALRLSASAGLLATHVGDVRLWDGGWEATEDGSRYRPSSKVWRLGTVVTVPLSVGLGFTF
jgi:hypothetical protein